MSRRLAEHVNECYRAEKGELSHRTIALAIRPFTMSPSNVVQRQCWHRGVLRPAALACRVPAPGQQAPKRRQDLEDGAEPKRQAAMPPPQPGYAAGPPPGYMPMGFPPRGPAPRGFPPRGPGMYGPGPGLPPIRPPPPLAAGGVPGMPTSIFTVDSSTGAVSPFTCNCIQLRNARWARIVSMFVLCRLGPSAGWNEAACTATNTSSSYPRSCRSVS